MPLPPPDCAREASHQRSITIRAYARGDGLWDVEGQLTDARVARGYRDAIRKLFGRTAGCTHINELAGAMGSAVLQALWPELTQGSDEKPFSIDGCHALKSSSPQVAQFFPRWYRPEPDGG